MDRSTPESGSAPTGAAALIEPAGDDTTVSIGKFVLAGVVIGAVSLFLLAGAAVYEMTHEWSAALGVALFAAGWGGPGFGMMFGAAAYALRTERAERRAKELMTHGRPLPASPEVDVHAGRVPAGRH